MSNGKQIRESGMKDIVSSVVFAPNPVTGFIALMRKKMPTRKRVTDFDWHRAILCFFIKKQ